MKMCNIWNKYNPCLCPDKEINQGLEKDDGGKKMKHNEKFENCPICFPLKKIEIEDDGEDGCYIDYSNFAHFNSITEINPEQKIIQTGGFFEEKNVNFDTIENNSKLYENGQITGNYEKGQIRQFATGATRDTSEGKLEFARFMSPIVIKRYAEYMDLHRKQTDGNLREPDNWMNLFGDKHEDVCMDSLFRHLMDVWLINKGFKNEAREDLETALCAILFNTQAWLFKILKGGV